MENRIIWLVVSCLMVLSLVLASCAPKVAEEKEVVTEEKEVVTEKKETVTEKKEVVAEKPGMVTDALGRTVEAPQYGGTVTRATVDEPEFVDDIHPGGTARSDAFMRLTTESLLTYDRLKGPMGSREWAGLIRWTTDPAIQGSLLAESWEIIQPDTVKYKIRQGVYLHDRAPANGAMLTADDVLFSFVRLYGEKKENLYGRSYRLFLLDPDNVENSIYIDPDDPWTVVVKSKPGQLAYIWENTAAQIYIVPRAQEKAPGYTDRLDAVPDAWQWLTGTGPFMIKDYIRGTSITFERNPNYWRMDDFHPDNQLPYIDQYREIVVPDVSTRMAAMRTGKIDHLSDLTQDDLRTLQASNPEVLSAKRPGEELQMFMRVDQGGPWADVNVRRAMMMAIDHPSIVNDYYDGDAIQFYYLAWPIPEHQGFWVPLEQQTELIQQMYGYHPDIAARMLDEAGYPGPNRFTTSITIDANNPEYVDVLSVVKSQWDRVGVTLNLDVKEHGVWESMRTGVTYPGGLASTIRPLEAVKWTKNNSYHINNYARLNEPWIDEGALEIQALFFDIPARDAFLKEWTVKLQEFVLWINLPLPNWYTTWQPWLKNYYGEERTAYTATDLWLQYVWIDRDLREEMTGRR